mgnify:FL=1
MIGFPYHISEVYFGKIAKKHDLYIVENDNDKQFIEQVKIANNQHIDVVTGEILEATSVPKELYEIFGEWLEVK